MKLKLIVLTPKNQAEKSVETMKGSLLGFNLSKRVKEQKVVSNDKFYWIMEIEKEKELNKLSKKVAAGEIMIRKFYRTLMKNIDRCNKLGVKFGKGLSWIKKQLIKRLRKATQQQQNDDFINNLESMDEPATAEFIKINDREAMEKLLAKDLLVLEVIED